MNSNYILAHMELEVSRETMFGQRSFVTISIPNELFPTPPPVQDNNPESWEGWEYVAEGWWCKGEPGPGYELLTIGYVYRSDGTSELEAKHHIWDEHNQKRVEAPDPTMVEQWVAYDAWVHNYIHLMPADIAGRKVDDAEFDAFIEGLPDWYDAYARALNAAKTTDHELDGNRSLVTFCVKSMYLEHIESCAVGVAALLDAGLGITLRSNLSPDDVPMADTADW